jgi:transposase
MTKAQAVYTQVLIALRRGEKAKDIAIKYDVDPATICRWWSKDMSPTAIKKRAKRQGRKRKIPKDVEERIGAWVWQRNNKMKRSCYNISNKWWHHTYLMDLCFSWTTWLPTRLALCLIT